MVGGHRKQRGSSVKSVARFQKSENGERMFAVFVSFLRGKQASGGWMESASAEVGQ
jgi:hypothetical protein